MPNSSTKKKIYSFLQAIAAAQNGMKFKEVSEKNGVPVTIIHDKKNSKYALDKCKPGEYTAGPKNWTIKYDSD